MSYQTDGICILFLEGCGQRHVSHVPSLAISANWERSTSSQQLHSKGMLPCVGRQILQMHLVGPLLASSEGHMYLLTAIDRLTRCVKAVPLWNMEATPYTAALATWVAGFGRPTTVTSDKGTQFIFALWTSKCKRLGIQQVLTTSYHPQSNSMVKCVHRQGKDALWACGAGLVCYSHLPWVLLGLHAVPKKDSMVSSAELVLEHPFHTSKSADACARAPTSWCGSCTHEAGVLCSGCWLSTSPFGECAVRVLASWWPAKAASRAQMPAHTGCWPKWGQDPDQAKGGDHLIGWPKAPHICTAPWIHRMPPVSAVPANSQPPLQSSLQLHEDADWGGGAMWRSSLC